MPAPGVEASEAGPGSSRRRELVARLRVLSPFIALVALLLLFELPTTIRSHGIDVTALRPTGDFLALLTVYPLLRGRRAERALRRGWLALLGVLIAVRIDWTICWLITRSKPLFYDQLFLVRHLAVLVSDLWSVQLALALVACVLAVWGTVAVARFLSRASRAAFLPPRARATAWSLGAAWCVVLVLTLLPAGPGGNRPRVRWIFPELVANLAESYRIYGAVQRGIVDSPYAGYSAIRLTRRPNVTFFFVESYGRVIADSPDLAARLSSRLTDMQRALEGDGWRMASGFSTAPVSGGRSWLAVGSVFMGTKVEYETVFRHLVREPGSVPSIPSFLASSGYDTIALEPSVRVRPGVEDANYYRFRRQIRFDDLNYTGKAIGWGLVPDQYSLSFAENEALVAASSRPRFFTFHMVSSHIPWAVVPEVVADWRSLNDAGGAPVRDAHGEAQTLAERIDWISRSLARYGHDEDEPTPPRKRRKFGSGFRERYVDTVAYDLSLIERYLLGRHADELVIVMGDHQPPAVTPDGENFDVPVHVFARDPALLAEFCDRGFSSGLVIDAQTPSVVDHAGIFSLLVRDLVRVQPSGPALPAFLLHGVPLAG